MGTKGRPKITRMPYSSHKNAAAFKRRKAMTMQEALTEEQMEIYKEASEQRKAWLECFVASGDMATATKKMYPHLKEGIGRQVSYQLRQYFKIDMAQLFRILGIDEFTIFNKTQQLLNAERVVKTFRRGQDTVEITEEDNFAIAKGLDIAIKQTGNATADKILHGEDPNNRFTSLADAFKSMMTAGPAKQPPEEPIEGEIVPPTALPTKNP